MTLGGLNTVSWALILSLLGSPLPGSVVEGKPEMKFSRSLPAEATLEEKLEVLGKYGEVFDAHDGNPCAANYIFANRSWYASFWNQGFGVEGSDAISCGNPYGICACKPSLDEIAGKYDDPSARALLERAMEEDSGWGIQKSYLYVTDLDANKLALFTDIAEVYVNGDMNFSDALREAYANFDWVREIHWDLMPDDVETQLKGWSDSGFMIHAYQDFEGVIDSYLAAEDADERSNDPGEVLKSLKQRLDLVRADRKLITRFAEKEGIPVGLLFYSLGDYSRTVTPSMRTSPQERRREDAHKYLDARQLAIASIPFIHTLMTDDLRYGVFVARGGIPGKWAVEEMRSEFGLDIKPELTVFKVSSMEKMLQAYAFTGEAEAEYSGDISEVRLVAKRIMELRDKRIEYRKSDDDVLITLAESQISDQMKELSGRLSDFYSQFEGRIRELHLDAFKKKHPSVGGERVAFFDDFVMGGGTRDYALELARSAGAVDVSEGDFHTFVLTEASRGKHLLAVKDAVGAKAKTHKSWTDKVMQWHDNQAVIGLNAGMDDLVEDAEQLFAMRRITCGEGAYELSEPADVYYSDAEKGEIVREVMFTYLGVDKQTNIDLVGEIEHGLGEILSSYNVREKSHEAVGVRVNLFIAKSFRQMVKQGVRDLAEYLDENGVTRDDFANYLSGEMPEQQQLRVDMTLTDFYQGVKDAYLRYHALSYVEGVLADNLRFVA
ncbi:hypothetical protein HN419_06705 [Candidatus Woesearchaeota archaeon]|jgi:hypothetical protein|nr:hypothetical protein [Candidatus Woesearchaeota archaeon]MBT3538185.1 hypothetical protein [Candidatus Woesearchaeota archaeon]MBT4697456.1 hypothetical protein [Candidatus Woesearchaeota archaeon]MBT4716622.1 hypothetical protein [Candidatus Woesearchaeota archaeon]MBT7105854.1 hypothetical protein [Candidatus Woesearchaeota archaeon]